MEKLNNDIYDITSTVVDIEQKYIDEEDPDTLAMGIFGNFADIESLALQNAIISTGELGNELFPARAKYERNLLAHAICNNIDNINAVPSTIECIIGIFEDDFEKYATFSKFILDKDIAIYIDSIEYHLEYDITIAKNPLPNDTYAYTAQYNITINNPLSDITNPYLNAPFTQYYNGRKMVYFYTRLMQVEQSTIHKKIITNNLIENKTILFKFSNQLAGFMIKATDGDSITYLTPILDGSGIDDGVSNYCYYDYADASHIRVRFDSSSYLPRLNTEIDVILKTTIGASGVFEYNKTQYPIVQSDTYGYDNLALSVAFGGKSEGGLDRISVRELKKVLPKASISRGSIICQKDLDNHFSMYNTDSNRLITQKRVDNQFERSYYLYLLLKDIYGNVIPTNTFNIKVAKSAFDTNDNRKFVLKPGCYIQLLNGVGTVIKRDDAINGELLDELETNDKTNFIYTVPFMLIVTGDPLYVSYYLAVIDDVKYLDFTYINMQSSIQFIAVNIRWKRNYLTDPNTYKMLFSISQNLTAGTGIIEIGDDGTVTSDKIKIVVVFYNTDDSTTPYRYIYAEVNEVDVERYTYEFIAKLETTDIINDDNKIRINDVYVPGTSTLDYGYFNKDLEAKIYICAKLEGSETGYGRYDLDSIVPGLEGYTVSNMYTVDGGVSLYVNYSQIIHSQITDIVIEGGYSDEDGFALTSCPCVRRSYTNTESSMTNFINEINYKKAYIDNALQILDGNMSLDFKFFNTYGPSKTYTLDRLGLQLIDRINLTASFALKLISTADKNTKDYIAADVKEYIEDLNDISSLHIPNLITSITNAYSNLIEYFEFLGFNDYGPGVQHLYHQDDDDATLTPEFLTVHTDANMTADISIRLD